MPITIPITFTSRPAEVAQKIIDLLKAEKVDDLVVIESAWEIVKSSLVPR